MNQYTGFPIALDEVQKLDRLFGDALLDDDLCKRLLHPRDASILNRYNLSRETREKLRSIHARTLRELASNFFMTAIRKGNGAR